MILGVVRNWDWGVGVGVGWREMFEQALDRSGAQTLALRACTHLWRMPALRTHARLSAWRAMSVLMSV